ncbi:hypothetical protein AD929_15810 [Gluconobacter potus]|uniref:Uncharacterized protein n=1 Tax=Gluconobacter potus TaxID=2724927 RepID=A0A149QPL7_9PROT|nr:hypothetical protein AD929_15810 [Gluconobacter potus]
MTGFMMVCNSHSAIQQLSMSVAVGMAGSTLSKVGITSAVLTCEAMTSAETYETRGATRDRMTAHSTIILSSVSANSKSKVSSSPVVHNDRETFRVGGKINA